MVVSIEQITPGQGSFSNFQTVDGGFDTIRQWLSRWMGETMSVRLGGGVEVNQSRPVELVFCSKWLN